jgi:hypothetical protein
MQSYKQLIEEPDLLPYHDRLIVGLSCKKNETSLQYAAVVGQCSESQAARSISQEF